MTEAEYLYDSYLKKAEAKILQIEPLTDGQTFVILDKTIFYAQGGGQPSDIGIISGSKGKLHVKSIEYNKGEIKHIGRLEGDLKTNDQVTLEIDWDKRLQHMVWHSAGHLLDEVIVNINPNLIPVSGMHGIGGKMYIEYEGKIENTEKLINEINNKLKDLQNKPLSITTKFVTLEELKKISSWIPTNLPSNKKLRVMQIGKGRVIPDGGTQVKNTSELPTIKVTKIEVTDKSFKVVYSVNEEAKLTTSEKTVTQIEQTPELENSIKQLKEDLVKTSTITRLKEIETKYLGKKGVLNQIFDQLSREEKAKQGRNFNNAKQEVQNKINDKNSQLAKEESEKDFDVTVPGITPPIGHLHLITQTIKEISDIFEKIGFIRRRYPEVETDWYAAEGLNIPKDHPARDDQETFYVSDNIVLTPHTSNGQLREMQAMKTPPIKMINIGKTYRRQIDVSHTPMFHQFEGLLIDKNINITHLIGVGNYFVQNYFGPDRRIRLRPHHFQFTEPSFEIDITCGVCGGTGCRLCKAGWLELGGAGMVHPTVLKNGSIDPKKYSGFAFGWGVERVLAMKYNLPDIRNIYSTDLRILTQF